MRLGSWVLVAAFAAECGVAMAQGAATEIPVVHGTVLTGEKVDLPNGLRGKVGVLVVVFSEGSRVEATNWGKRLAADYRDSDAVVYYEMPVLESVPRLLRGWVLKKIADSVPDRAKPRFLPVIDHEKEWKSATGFARPDDAYVLVVDGAGSIAWKTEGGTSDAAYAEVRRRVEALQSAAPK